MYVGSTDANGLMECALEVIGNAIDQHLQGHATRIEVSLTDGQLTVHDDGQGFSPGLLEPTFTSLHFTPTRDGERAHVHATNSGLGCGLGVVSALAERLEVESVRDGVRSQAVFARGKPLHEPSTAVARSRGVRIRFTPDRTIFQTGFDEARLRARLVELARLSPNLGWRFQNVDLSARDGLLDFIADAGALLPGTTEAFNTELDDVGITVAVGLRSLGTAPALSSWVNFAPTLGGSHQTGLLNGLRDAWGPDWSRLSSRVSAAVHLRLHHPRFKGPTRALLAVPRTGTLVRRFTREVLSAPSGLRIGWLEHRDQ